MEVEKWLAAKYSHFLVITEGNLDHLFSYAAGNGGDQKSDLVFQAFCPEGLKKVKGEGGVSLLPPLLTLCFVSISSHTHTQTHTVGAHTGTHSHACCAHRQADREEKVDTVILLGGYWGS